MAAEPESRSRSPANSSRATKQRAVNSKAAASRSPASRRRTRGQQNAGSAGRPEAASRTAIAHERCSSDSRGPADSAGLLLVHAVVHRRGADFVRDSSVRPRAPMLGRMSTAAALPLFHLYGDPPDDQAFDFIHVETIASRSSSHDWPIRAHRHRNLFQILLIERGGGDMTFEAANPGFAAPAAILVPPTTAHGFRFRPAVTDGWVVSFTEDVAAALGERSGEALKRLKALAAEPVIPLADASEITRLSRALQRSARGKLPGARRLPPCDARTAGADRDRGGAARGKPRAHRRGDARARGCDRRCAATAGRGAFPQGAADRFYAEKLAITPDRLNDHVKRATGVTAGHLIRQRVLTEAKRQLVFTGQAIHEISTISASPTRRTSRASFASRPE